MAQVIYNHSAWWKQQPYDAELPKEVSSALNPTMSWRDTRVQDISALAWMYGRERWLSYSAGPNRQIPDDVGKRYDWLKDNQTPPSINIVKSSVDTLTAWMFTEPTPIEVAGVNASFEQRRAIEARSLALDSTINSPINEPIHRKVGRDGILKGFGAIKPIYRNRRIEYRRLHYYQIYWDPHDARDGFPRCLYTVEVVDRDEFLGWYRSLVGVRNHKRRIRQFEELAPTVPTQSSHAEGGHSGYWTGPYDWELEQSGIVDATDRIRIVTAWRRASSNGADDGRMVILGMGGHIEGPGKDSIRGVVAVDMEFPRATFPVCFWSPFPADEGVDGGGVGHLLVPWQEAIDRTFFKIQKSQDRYGHVKVIVPKSSIENLHDFLAVGITVVEVEGFDSRPVIVDPKVLRPEDIELIDRWLSYSRSEYGVNQMLTGGQSRLGANAPAIALVEEEGRALDRLNDIRAEYDHFRLRVAHETLHAIDDARKLDPRFRVSWEDKRGVVRTKSWSALSLPTEDSDLRLEKAGFLGRTKAGRVAKLLDYSQRGLVDPDLAKDALLSSPDVRKTARLATAGMRLVELDLERLIDPSGEHDRAIPDPEYPLELALSMAEKTIWSARADGAEQATIERLRGYRRQVESLLRARAAEQSAAAAPMDAQLPTPTAAMPDGEQPIM